MDSSLIANAHRFYIDGAWVEPSTSDTLDVVNPATEEVIGSIAMGGRADVDRAVAAASEAFETFSRTNVDDRVKLLDRITEVYGARMADLGEAVGAEMGAPPALAAGAQAPAGWMHFLNAKSALENFEFETQHGTTLIVKEPIGVCGLITPWNWPLNQIACKVGPAIAAGCTMVLKPSEVAPYNAVILAEILDEAGVPAGVFNLVNGDGPTVGDALSSHPDVHMMSFTGSTRAGIEVAKSSAATVKRVTQELGGKSANIILDDADLTEVIPRDLFGMCMNSGQSCNAATRMLVPNDKMDEAAAIAGQAAAAINVGDPDAEGINIGPVVSELQFDKIQGLIQAGIDEGAQLAAGGPGRPEGVEKGYYVRPTVFSHVTNEMTIAREEIFGPVMVIIGYEDDEDAIRIANDTPYGLSGYISGSPERAKSIARRIRTGNMHVNGAGSDFEAPFGGYKQSGNGREWGPYGLEEFFEHKAIFGFFED